MAFKVSRRVVGGCWPEVAITNWGICVQDNTTQRAQYSLSKKCTTYLKSHLDPCAM